MMDSDLKSIEKIQDLTYELMSAFHSGLFWLVEYCEKNNLPMPDLDKARGLITTTNYVLEHSEYTLSTESLHAKDQPQNGQNLKTITL